MTKILNNNPLHDVLTLSEASEIWEKESLAITIKSETGNFVESVDWRKSSGIILINRDAMWRVYGDPKDKISLSRGLTKKSFERKLGMERVGKQKLIPGDKGDGRKFTHSIQRVVYKHKTGNLVARILDVWFILEGDRITDEYIEYDEKLYEDGRPSKDNLTRLGFLKC